jgi:hypothetical protein
MAEKKERQVILTIGNARIKEYDSHNVQVERYENVFLPKTQETIQKWVFKGYSRSILSALLKIQRDELLIDTEAVTCLEEYVQEVKDSNEKLVQALEGVK